MDSSAAAGKLILVVDDEDDILVASRIFLEGKGYSVLEARNGVAALDVLKTARPHLIILDVIMPGLDGWETLRRIKEDEDLKDTPVLMLTALGDREHVAVGISLGCTFYYAKPVTDYDEFGLVIDRLLQTPGDLTP